MAMKGGSMQTSSDSRRAYDELILVLLEDADKDMQCRALETLGHQACVQGGEAPISREQRMVDVEMQAEQHRQRAEQAGKDLAQERQRAETAEEDAEWYRVRLRELDAEAKWQKQRAAEAEDEAERWQNRVERLRELLQDLRGKLSAVSVDIDELMGAGDDSR
jgi:predicted  nucleic acid-binding Zn-ribbon protein